MTPTNRAGGAPVAGNSAKRSPRENTGLERATSDIRGEHASKVGRPPGSHP